MNLEEWIACLITVYFVVAFIGFAHVNLVVERDIIPASCPTEESCYVLVGEISRHTIRLIELPFWQSKTAHITEDWQSITFEELCGEEDRICYFQLHMED